MSPPIINRRSVVQENSNDSVVKNNNRADKRIRRNRNHPNMLLSMCKSLQSYDMDGNIIRVKKGKDCYKKMMVTNNSKMLNRKINGLNEQVGKRNNSKHNPYKKRVSLKREENVKESVQMELVKKDEFDGVWIGEVLKKKSKDEVRIWYQNVNGISVVDSFEDFQVDLEWIKENEIDFLACSEIKINESNYFAVDRIRQILKNHFQGGMRMRLTNTPDCEKEIICQSGGVMEVALNKLAFKYAGCGRDTCGSFCWMSFRGEDGYFKIYTVYRVNKDKGDKEGDTTAWVNQYNFLNKNGGNINPRNNILERLVKVVEKDIVQGDRIMIIGDMNEDVCGSKFVSTFSNLGLINLIPNIVQNKGIIRTHKNGSRVIDGCWATSSIADKVRSMGFAPFGLGMKSDHRGLFLDINLKQMLKSEKLEISRRDGRRLYSTMPKRALAYSNRVEFCWKYHKMSEKIDRIVQGSKAGTTKSDLGKMLNKVDMQITQILRNAEKSCTKLQRTAIYDWSPVLSDAVKKKRKIQQEIAKVKKIMIDENGHGTNAGSTIQTLVHKLREQKRYVKELKKDHVQHRVDHLDECAKEKVRLIPGKDFSKEIKQLQHIEFQRREARAIKRVLKQNIKTGLQYILIPAKSEYSGMHINKNKDYMRMDVIWERLSKHNGKDVVSWERVEEKRKIESMVLQCLQFHFGQAHGTPLTSERWKKKLVDEKFINSIIEGKVQCHDEDEQAVKDYFMVLSQVAEKVKMKPIQYSFEQWSSFIKNVKEITSTSPSGRHYGHCKTLREYLPNVFYQIYLIMNIAIENGILLERWKNTVTIVIEKDAGMPKIHRLRPLHIIEPEIGAMVKHVWAKQIMKRAEEKNKITDDQYGGRAARQAQSAVLNKLLYYDLGRQTLIESQYDDDDLKANYDRELVRLVAAEARIKHGLDKDNANLMINFVESQKFFLKTGYGISKKYYKYEDQKPIYGLGQGIAWSGPGWLLSSDTITRCKLKNGLGLKFKGPISNIEVHKMHDMFVDDTSCGCNCAHGGKTIMEQAQENLQRHVDYVRVTGGCFALDKCSFYHVKYKFKNGHPQVENNTENRSKMIIRQNGQLQEIKKLEPDEEHKTLGCYVSPTGNNVKAFNQLQQMARNWAMKIKGSNLAGYRRIQAYETGLKMQWEYRLPLYSLSFQQCDKIMQMIRPVLKNAVNVNEKIPNIILEAGNQYFGYGFRHLYDMQGIAKTKMLFMHWRRGDTTAKLLRISMETSQMECGASKLFLNLDVEKWEPLLTETWLVHLWKYWWSRSVGIEMSDFSFVKAQRKNDQHIMDLIMDANLTTVEKFKINAVRQSLEVVTLADIVTANGRDLLDSVRVATIGRTSKLQFRKQQFPSTWLEVWKLKACRIFQKALHAKPLGDWKVESHQNWKWTLSHDHKFLCSESLMLKVETGNKYVNFREKLNDEEMMEKINNNKKVYNVDVRKYKKSVKIIGVHKPVMNIASNEYSEWETKYMKLWGDIEMGGYSFHDIMVFISTGKLLVATDGSNKWRYGVAAWGLAFASNNIEVRGRQLVRAQKRDANSTRSEIVAVLTVVSFLEFVRRKFQHWERNKKPIKIYIDSQSAISSALKTWKPVMKNVLANDMDVRLELAWVLKQTDIKFQFCKVKSHQDSKKNIEDLTRAEKLNVQVDEFASEFYETKEFKEQIQYVEKMEFFTAQKLALRIFDITPVSNIAQQMVDFKLGHQVEEYIAKKMHLRTSMMKYIDWKGLLDASNCFSRPQRLSMCKMFHQHWHTMRVSHRNKEAEVDICPLCKEKVETCDHVIKCEEPSIVAFRNELLLQFKKNLKCLQTQPVLERKIIILIRKWIQGYPIRITVAENEIDNAINDQIRLGVENMRKGIISEKLRAVQENYYSSIDCNKKYFTGDYWAKRVIIELMTFSKEMWLKRCEIVHELDTHTLNKRTRMKARELFLRLKQSPWNLMAEDRKLLERKLLYFETTHLGNINSWIKRINVALYNKAIMEKKSQMNLRNWIKSGVINKNERAQIARRNDKRFFQKKNKCKGKGGRNLLMTSFLSNK